MDNISVSHHQHRPASLCFPRRTLSLLTGRQWRPRDSGIHERGKLEVGASDGNPTPTLTPETLVRSCVCVVPTLSLHLLRGKFTPRSLFNVPIPPRSREKPLPRNIQHFRFVFRQFSNLCQTNSLWNYTWITTEPGKAVIV